MAAGAGAVVLAGLGAAGPVPAHAAEATTITIVNAPRTYFLPVHGDASRPQPYRVTLASGSEVDLRDVRASFDFSALRGKVAVALTGPGGGGPACTAGGPDGLLVTCDLGDFYQGTDVQPVTLTALEGTPTGDLGPIVLTATASNAPPASVSTELVIGRPQFTVGKDTSAELTSDTVSIAPVFGNRGDVALTQGVSLVISGTAMPAPRYTNCLYNDAEHPTMAQCEFDQALEPGSAFRTSGDFTFAADPRTAPVGLDVIYDVWPTGNSEYPPPLREGAPRGTVEPLTLTAVEDSGLQLSSGSHHHFDPQGGLHVDYAATGFAIKGAVGATLQVVVPHPTNDKGVDLTWTEPRQTVRMPPGVRAMDPSDVYQGEEQFCAPGDGGRTASCPYSSEPFDTLMLVHIDAKVPGAKGSITTPTKPGVDLNQTNNTAPITTEITGGPGGGAAGGSGPGGSGSGGSGSGGTGSGGSASAGSGSGSGSGGAGGGTSSGGSGAASAGTSGSGGGSLAATGSGGTPLLAGLGVAGLLAGAAVFAAARRRRS